MPKQPELSIEGLVDFGSIVANSRVIARQLPLVNNGAKEGEFKFRYTGKKPIMVIPDSGKVKAKSTLMIRVRNRNQMLLWCRYSLYITCKVHCFFIERN